MSAQSSEGNGITFLFLIVWYALANHTPLSAGDAFWLSCILMAVAWLAIRMAGRAIYRLGSKGWSLILQLAGWFGLFLWFAPLNFVPRILIVWGIGIPLVFAGAAWRHVHDAFPSLHERIKENPRSMLGGLFFVLFAVLWGDGAGFLGAIATAAFASGLIALPLYYGWRLAEPLPSADRDARFGTGDTYRETGMSDER